MGKINIFKLSVCIFSLSFKGGKEQGFSVKKTRRDPRCSEKVPAANYKFCESTVTHILTDPVQPGLFYKHLGYSLTQ